MVRNWAERLYGELLGLGRFLSVFVSLYVYR